MARVVRLAFFASLEDGSTDIAPGLNPKAPYRHARCTFSIRSWPHSALLSYIHVQERRKHRQSRVHRSRPSLELIEQILSYLQLAAAGSVSLTCQRLLFHVDVDYDRDLTAVPKMLSRATLNRTYPPDSFSSLVCFIVWKNREEQEKPKESGRPAVGQLYGCALCELGIVPRCLNSPV